MLRQRYLRHSYSNFTSECVQQLSRLLQAYAQPPKLGLLYQSGEQLPGPSSCLQLPSSLAVTLQTHPNATQGMRNLHSYPLSLWSQTGTHFVLTMDNSPFPRFYSLIQLCAPRQHNSENHSAACTARSSDTLSTAGQCH